MQATNKQWPIRWPATRCVDIYVALLLWMYKVKQFPKPHISLKFSWVSPWDTVKLNIAWTIFRIQFIGKCCQLGYGIYWFIYSDNCKNNNCNWCVCVIKQAYKRYKKSLCLVSANVSTMKEEYFHHKTTPDFPIVLAVRSTNSLPGI